MVESRRGESRRVQSSCNGIEDEKVFIVGWSGVELHRLRFRAVEVSRVHSSCNGKGDE